jgi:NADH-quinone oxidoreductase subunit E
VVSFFAKQKLLYESCEQSANKTKEYHNAVFVGYDENGVPCHAHKRGIYSHGNGFKGNIESGNPCYSFHYTGISNRLYVFEAPIDMLSFITIYKNIHWQEHSYVALCGVSVTGKGVGNVDCCGAKELKGHFLDEEVDLSLMDETLKKYKEVKGSLITILQNAQEIYGFLPMSVLEYISQETGIYSSQIYGVATFYTQFRLNPVGENLIMLCKGTACHVNGADGIEEAITEELGIKDGETTEDKIFTLNNVACLGCCSLSPVMMVNGETYGSLTPQKTKEILREIGKQALDAKEGN